MNSLSRSSGREALTAWLQSRARLADRGIVLEEALLSGRFAHYAFRRLLAFGLARAAGIFVHLVELTWLFEIFSAKAFVASIALQNVTLVVDAFFWGALESLRQRLQLLGTTSEATALVTRWMTIAGWVAIGAVSLPIAMFAFGKREDVVLHAYAFACGLRLAADVVLRTYYSGVFAYGRVHRPVWVTVLSPFLVIGVTVAGWDSLGGYAFVAALLVSLAVSRGFLFVFTRRAYARLRLPRPRFRLWSRGVMRMFDGKALLAGIANLSTRLGGVVLLAALMPSLTMSNGLDEEPVIEPFAFSLHLAAPFLLLASQWAFVFYHDWKRLEREESSRLARSFDRRLTLCAIALGIVSAIFASVLVLIFVPWSRSWPTLASLLIATVGMSIWTSMQLRHFAHGQHMHQAISAGAIVIVVSTALAADELGVVAFYFALASGPWVALGLAFVLERLLQRQAHGLLGSTASFIAAASRAKGRLVVWDARVEKRAPAVAERIALKLGTHGAVIRTKTRVVWFESSGKAARTSRADWLALGGGRLRTLTEIELRPEEVRPMLAAHGIVREPVATIDPEALARRHGELFPNGFVLRLDAPPPARFATLPSSTRQAIWRDALRFQTGRRGQSGWFVSCLTRNGVPETIFAAPRPIPPEHASEWRKTIADADWRLASDLGEAVNVGSPGTYAVT